MKKVVNKKRKIKWGLLVVCFLVTYSIAFLGSLFTSPVVNTAWYNSIKPVLTPPNIVFPIVWNILFFMISISLYLALTNVKTKEDKLNIWVVFGINFIFNILWSIFYFGLKNPGLAFIEVLFLDCSVIYLILITRKINKISALLLVPYLLWLSFATILNYLSIFM